MMSDLIIAIFDSSKELTDEDLEILQLAKSGKTIILLNKIDLEPKINREDERLRKVSNHIVEISALNNTGLENLYNEISKMFNLSEINLDSELIITNIRHKNLISKAIEDIEKTKKTIKDGMPLDIVAIYIKELLEMLGNITGDIVSDDIINEIFSKFCLGK